MNFRIYLITAFQSKIKYGIQFIKDKPNGSFFVNLYIVLVSNRFACSKHLLLAIFPYIIFMKKIFACFLVLSPIITFSQCISWIGNRIDSSLALEKIAEKYLDVRLEKTIDKAHKNNFDFQNTSCDCEFLFSTHKVKAKGKKRHTAVNEIVINGPVDKVKKMFYEYFYPRLKPCASSIQHSSLTINGIIVGFYTIPLHGEKIGQINFHR